MRRRCRHDIEKPKLSIEGEKWREAVLGVCGINVVLMRFQLERTIWWQQIRCFFLIFVIRKIQYVANWIGSAWSVAGSGRSIGSAWSVAGSGRSPGRNRFHGAFLTWKNTSDCNKFCIFLFFLWHVKVPPHMEFGGSGYATGRSNERGRRVWGLAVTSPPTPQKMRFRLKLGIPKGWEEGEARRVRGVGMGG